jgi:hypothetical protein
VKAQCSARSGGTLATRPQRQSVFTTEQKLTKIFTALYVSLWVSTMFTRSHHSLPSWARWIQSTYTLPFMIDLNIRPPSFHLHLGSQVCPLPPGFGLKFMHVLSHGHVTHYPHISSSFMRPPKSWNLIPRLLPLPSSSALSLQDNRDSSVSIVIRLWIWRQKIWVRFAAGAEILPFATPSRRAPHEFRPDG